MADTIALVLGAGFGVVAGAAGALIANYAGYQAGCILGLELDSP